MVTNFKEKLYKSKWIVYAPVLPALCGIFFTPWLPLALLEITIFLQKVILIGQPFATLTQQVTSPISQDIGHTDIKCVSKTNLALPPVKDKKIHSKIFKKSPYCYSSEGIPKSKPTDIPKIQSVMILPAIAVRQTLTIS